MIAIIPVAGAGKRLRPLTNLRPKPLVPVAGKPILSYIIDNLIDLGVTEFVFVIGYLGDKVKTYVKSTYPKLHTRFVVQNNRFGSGHAIWLAGNVISADEVLVVFGDTIIAGPLKEIVNSSSSCVGVKKVEDPRSFGIVHLSPDGSVDTMIEKPKMPKSNLAIVGFYKIADFQLLHAVLSKMVARLDGQNVVTLTDGLKGMLDEGHRIETKAVEQWFDCGNVEILLTANKNILRKQTNADKLIQPFDKTIIIHPVSIGKNCKISNAVIGPYVSIGDNTEVEHAIIKDSIVGSDSHLSNLSIHHSIVGNDTTVSGINQRINIGDNTELTLY